MKGRKAGIFVLTAALSLAVVVRTITVSAADERLAVASKNFTEQYSWVRC